MADDHALRSALRLLTQGVVDNIQGWQGASGCLCCRSLPGSRRGCKACPRPAAQTAAVASHSIDGALTANTHIARRPAWSNHHMIPLAGCVYVPAQNPWHECRPSGVATSSDGRCLARGGACNKLQQQVISLGCSTCASFSCLHNDKRIVACAALLLARLSPGLEVGCVRSDLSDRAPRCSSLASQWARATCTDATA